MRRLGTASKQYRVEFSPAVQARMAELPSWLSQQLRNEIASLAELADLAPIPQVGGITDDRTAPPLHLTVGDWVLTYLIDRRMRTIRVVAIERT